MKSTRDLYFVYLGTSLPRYARASLVLAAKQSGLRVHLLGNAALGKFVPKELVSFTPIENFYDFREFQEAANRLMYSHTFRSGFWLKSLERLFVLEQFMRASHMEKIFHAELDQLLFRVDRLLDRLDQSGPRGLFLPFHDTQSVVASILYCNDYGALRSLLDFSSSQGVFPNEMALMADWAAANPRDAIVLPTLGPLIMRETDAFSSTNNRIMTSSQAGGIVDAAQLGQWIGGIDPRNVPLKQLPQTKFVDPPSAMLMSLQHLERLHFELNHSDGRLVCRDDKSMEVTVYNLHLHSKIHTWLLRSDSNVDRLFMMANQNYPSRLPGTRKSQVSHILKSRITEGIRNPGRILSEIRYRFNRKLNRRPSNYPYLSGDTFRAVADHIWEKSNENIQSRLVKSGDIIFCESDVFENFDKQVLRKVAGPVTLLLGNSDRAWGSELGEVCTRVEVKRVFAQNLVEEVLGVDPLPAGLVNAWVAGRRSSLNFGFLRRNNHIRRYRILWSSSVGADLEDSKMAANELVDYEFAERLELGKTSKLQKSLSQFAFLACPQGMGIESHRVWEAMYRGCIPIVTRSYMATSYERMGLPIWVIESFKELTKFDEVDLEEKYIEFKVKFESEALWADYWFTRIKSLK